MKQKELIEKIEEIINSIQEQTEERCIESCLDKMEWNGYCVSKYKLKSLIEQLKSTFEKVESKPFIDIKLTANSFRNIEKESGNGGG